MQHLTGITYRLPQHFFPEALDGLVSVYYVLDST